MTRVTIPQVRAWRPTLLVGAADGLTEAAAAVEQEAAVVRRFLPDALDDAGGAWAASARSRAAQESRSGLELADALGETARVLRTGATDLGEARARLVGCVDRARAAGFVVGPEGHVSRGGVPLSATHPGPEWVVLTPPEEAARAEAQRADHEAAVVAALASVVAVDAAIADSLDGISFPQTLESVLGAHLARSRVLGDPVAALGTAGGGVVAGAAAKDAYDLVTKARHLDRYLRLARQSPAAAGADDALRAFTHGTATHPVLKAGGRLFLPATVVGGVHDLATGGGHDGGRDWATRGFGLAGAAGGAALIASATPVLALTPVGLGIAGAAVLAYGAWSTGSYVADHWDQVEDATAVATDWAGEQVVAGAGEVAEAVGWAHDRLAEAGSGALAGVGDLF